MVLQEMDDMAEHQLPRLLRQPRDNSTRETGGREASAASNNNNNNNNNVIIATIIILITL